MDNTSLWAFNWIFWSAKTMCFNCRWCYGGAAQWADFLWEFFSLLISFRAQPCKKVNAPIHNGRSSLSTNTYVQPIAIQCSQHTLKFFRFCEIAQITEFIRPKESSCSFEIQYLFWFQNWICEMCPFATLQSSTGWYRIIFFSSSIKWHRA